MFRWLRSSRWIDLAFAGRTWQPTEIERVTRVLDTSTKPFLAMTDEGAAIVKYIGNPAGADALICELIGSELANMVGLTTPDFAILEIPSLALPNSPLVQVAPGPAFFSRWVEATSLSPDSTLLKKLRHPNAVAKLVVLDTWLRNKDRFAASGSGGYENVNYDNVLLRMDKRMVELVVIDHTHALVETTLEDEIGPAWVEEQTVYGLFNQFKPLLTRKDVGSALALVEQIDLEAIRRVCEGVPREWGMTSSLAERLSSCLALRGEALGSWLPAAIFDQYEMNFEQGEGA